MHFIRLTDATNVLLCTPGVALIQRACFFFMGIHFVSHCFLAGCFLPFQSDVLLSSAYDTSSLAALGISVPRKKRVRRAIHPKNKCVRVFLWQLNNICK